MVISAYRLPFRRNRTIAFSTLSFSVMLPLASCELIAGTEM